MRRFFQLSTFCLIAAVASACSTPDVVIPTEDIQTGGVRFINAVPNAPWGSGATGSGLDFRFIDNPENNAQWQMPFRNGVIFGANNVASAAATEYKPARAGVRKFRIFPNDTLQSVASTIIYDGEMTIVAEHNYTVIVMGLAGTTTGPDAFRVEIVDETAGLPAAGKVAIRLWNTSGAAVDGRAWLAGSPVPGAATWANVPAYTRSAYVEIDTGAQVFNLRAAGSATSLTCDVRSIPGQVAIVGPPGPLDAIPGGRVSGTALTALVFAGFVPGSKSASFTTTTGSTSIAATATGFAAARSFITDCFVVGQQVNVTGFATAGNNGLATITAIANGPTTGSTSLSAVAGGYARAAGSFITDGFVVGGWVTASGFATPANNGVSQITSVTATTLTVAKTAPPVVEAAATGRSIVGFGTLDVSKIIVPEAPASGRTIIVSPNPVGAAFVWDRRPPRPTGV
jgi:hypothetical protein